MKPCKTIEQKWLEVNLNELDSTQAARLCLNQLK